VEEEKNATDIVEQLKLVQDHPMGILMMDRQLGSRGAK
jgi:ferritin